MNEHAEIDPSRDEADPLLASVTEHITCRLQAGEFVDVDDYARRYPKLAGPIRRLLPTLCELVDLGQRVVRERGDDTDHDLGRRFPET